MSILGDLLLLCWSLGNTRVRSLLGWEWKGHWCPCPPLPHHVIPVVLGFPNQFTFSFHLSEFSFGCVLHYCQDCTYRVGTGGKSLWHFVRIRSLKTYFLYNWKLFFIVVKYTSYKICHFNYCKVYSAVALSICILLWNYHQYPSPECFLLPKQKICTH